MDSWTPEPTLCSHCGAPPRAAALFCARCGTRYAPAEENPQGIGDTSPKADQWIPIIASKSTVHWDELRAVGWLYGLLMFASLVGGIGYSIEPGRDFDFWITLVDAVVIVGFAAHNRKEVIPLLRPSRFDDNARKKLAVAVVIQFGVLGAAFYLLEKAGVPFDRVTDDMQRHHYSLWQLFALNSLAPALFEEIAFRGVIFGRLLTVLGEKEAWLVQAAFFSILHLSPVIFPTHFAMGLILGWLRMRTLSLLPGMVLHAAWNAVIILLELYR
jgi:membrane protease YdiL (CAAX protease family)